MAGGSASAKLIGAAEMRAKFANVRKNYPNKVGNALYSVMGVEKTEVIRRTPKLSGELRSTIKLIGPSDNGKTITVVIVAGGPDAPYAMIVHEDLEAFHNVGQAKYLESVIMESRAFIGRRVAAKLDIATWVN